MDSKSTTSTTLTPFSISIPQEEIDDLNDRLRRTRRSSPLPEDSRAVGVPQAHLDHLVTAWLDLDWREVERRLNDLEHVVTDISGQQIHAVHARSPHSSATPLILTHGWPGSFLEHVGLIERLTHPELHGGDDEDAFHVVIPSLPGFAFSTPLSPEADLSTAGIARTWLELMSRLGYERFVAQGGDIGASVSPEIGRLAPDRVIGVHVNGALGAFVTTDQADSLGELTELERDRLARVDRFMQQEFAYIALQSTRPALLGAMVADSPVALLAWILDKLQAWSWPEHAAAEGVLGIEFVLANASLYWFTRSAGTAAFVGYGQPAPWGVTSKTSGVPTAALQLAHDVGIRAAAERENTIVRWTDVTERGGHFAALEEPDLIVEDLRAFTRSLR